MLHCYYVCSGDTVLNDPRNRDYFILWKAKEWFKGIGIKGTLYDTLIYSHIFLLSKAEVTNPLMQSFHFSISAIVLIFPELANVGVLFEM